MKWILLLLGIGGSAMATDLPLTFLSGGNNPQGYVYVSPYTAEIDTTGEIITIYCIDFNHDVGPSTNWTAQIQPFDEANVASMQYGVNSTDLASTWLDYEAAAWLITQEIGVNPQSQNANYQEAVYQYAAWQIFLDPAHTGFFDESEAAVGQNFAALVDSAYNASFNAIAGGWVPTGWDIVTPDPAGQPDSVQEFLTVDPPGPEATPEPSSYILLATTFAIVFIYIRRRSRRSGEPDVSGLDLGRH